MINQWLTTFCTTTINKWLAINQWLTTNLQPGAAAPGKQMQSWSPQLSHSEVSNNWAASRGILPLGSHEHVTKHNKPRITSNTKS